MSHYTGGMEHRCHAHGLPRCTRSHQAAPYIRPEAPDMVPSGDWTMKRYDQHTTTNPWWRALRLAWAFLLATLVAAAIFGMAVYAGRSLAAASDPAPRDTIITPSPQPGAPT